MSERKTDHTYRCRICPGVQTWKSIFIFQIYPFAPSPPIKTPKIHLKYKLIWKCVYYPFKRYKQRHRLEDGSACGGTGISAFPVSFLLQNFVGQFPNIEPFRLLHSLQTILFSGPMKKEWGKSFKNQKMQLAKNIFWEIVVLLVSLLQ